MWPGQSMKLYRIRDLSTYFYGFLHMRPSIGKQTRACICVHILIYKQTIDCFVCLPFCLTVEIYEFRYESHMMSYLGPEKGKAMPIIWSAHILTKKMAQAHHRLSFGHTHNKKSRNVLHCSATLFRFS